MMKPLHSNVEAFRMNELYDFKQELKVFASSLFRLCVYLKFIDAIKSYSKVDLSLANKGINATQFVSPKLNILLTTALFDSTKQNYNF